MVTLVAGGERLRLLPEKAVFLEEHRVLLVADLHLGKAASFRRWGVPVPPGTTDEMLQRLDRLVSALQPRRIVFLGDFLHSARAQGSGALQSLGQWRDRRPGLGLTLVRGNHDLRAGDPPDDLRIERVDEPLRLGGLALCHHPMVVPGAYVLGGHLHPCIRVGRGLDSARLPCFWFGASTGVLPAFGGFTGMHPVQPEEGDRLYLVAEDRVLAAP